MRYVAIYIALIFLLQGCTLSETVTYTIDRRPGLAVGFDASKVTLADVYVFSPKGLFIDSARVVGAALRDTLTLLDGVVPGDYTVVSFMNGTRFSRAKLEKGVSTVKDIELKMTAAPILSCCDTVMHNVQSFRVERGDRVLQPIAMRELYYHVNVRISGFTELTQPIANFGVEFRRIPMVFDHEGLSFDPSGRVKHDVPDPQGVVVWPVLLNRFSDAHQVELHALSGGVSLGYVSVLPSAFGIDYTSNAPIELNVELVMQTAAITISVNDWYVGVIQLSSLGG